MRKKLLILSLVIFGLLAVGGTALAQQPPGSPGSIYLEKIPDAVMDLFGLKSHRQVYDTARTGMPISDNPTCDTSGEYTIHYWRTATEVGATAMDGCIDSSVSAAVGETLGAMDMADIPGSLLLLDPEGNSYTVNLFCTGEGKRVEITGSFAHCIE